MKLYIKSSHLLNNYFRSHLISRDDDVLSASESSAVQMYNDEWAMFEKMEVYKIMENIVGLQFKESEAPLYVQAGTMGAISDPMVLSPFYSQSEVATVIIHELSHRLISVNSEGILLGKYLYSKYGEENLTVRNHILVHSIMYMTFTKLNLLHLAKEDYDSFVKSEVPSSKDYVAAWDIALDLTCEKVINDLRIYLESERKNVMQNKQK